MITPQQFKEITGFDYYAPAGSNYKHLTAKRTYIFYLKNEGLSAKQISEFLDIQKNLAYVHYYTTTYDKDLLAKFTGKTPQEIEIKSLPLFECLDILHKDPRNYLWDKPFRTWTKNDFKEIYRLRDNGKT